MLDLEALELRLQVGESKPLLGQARQEDRLDIQTLLVLNLEAIHVAQSCSNQGLGSDPLLLGLPTLLPGHLSTVLNEPIYRTAPERVRQLEREAFANQDRLTLGVQLVQAHC